MVPTSDRQSAGHLLAPTDHSPVDCNAIAVDARRAIIREPMTRVEYRIDALDRLTAVGGEWKDFAEANSGAALLHESVIGRPLLGFIHDDTVRAVYAAVIAHARRGRPVRFRYRCDAPALRREFEMEVTLVGNSDVEFRSTLLRETPRPPIDLFRPTQLNAKALVRMCSWCHAIADAHDQWHDLETAIASMPILEEQRSVGVTHGICPPCAKAMFEMLENESKTKET